MKIETHHNNPRILLTQDEAKRLMEMASTIANSSFECTVQCEFEDSVCDWERFTLVLSSEG